MPTFWVYWQSGGAAEVAWAPHCGEGRFPQTVTAKCQVIAFTTSGKEYFTRHIVRHEVRVGATIGARVGVDERPLCEAVHRIIAWGSNIGRQLS